MPDPDGGWTIAVDRERCMGTGTCLVYASSIELDGEGKAAVRHPVTDDLAAAQSAVEACPTEALTIVGADR